MSMQGMIETDGSRLELDPRSCGKAHTCARVSSGCAQRPYPIRVLQPWIRLRQRKPSRGNLRGHAATEGRELP